MGFLMRRTKF